MSFKPKWLQKLSSTVSGKSMLRCIKFHVCRITVMLKTDFLAHDYRDHCLFWNLNFHMELVSNKLMFKQ